MKPSAFDYECPTDLKAVLALLGDDSDTRILAGGQSLVPKMNYRMAPPERLVDINRVPDLDYIRKEGGFIVIGALARHGDIKSSDLVIALTGGGPGRATELPATFMYSYTFTRNQMGIGAASAVIMLMTIAAIIVPYLWSELREKK